MDSLFQRRTRLSYLLFPVLALILAATPLSAAITMGSAHAAKETPPPTQEWTLADGEKLEGAITEYSLQSRKMSLLQRNGETIRISPRDLTAMSKLKWLSSSALFESIKEYRPPEGATRKLVAKLAAPVVALLASAFLAFWMGSAVVSGQKKIGPVLSTYAKCLFYALIVVVAAAFVFRATSIGFGSSPLAPFFQGLLVIGTLIVVFVVSSLHVGSAYGMTGSAGFGAVVLSLGIAGVMAVVTLYLMPRFLERPGIDDWFTDQLLAPLGLA